MSPILTLGYARPLDPEDLYKLQDPRNAKVIGDKIIASFERRRAKADAFNERLEKGEISPGLKSLWWSIRGNRKEREKQWREVHGKKRPSLVLAMNDSVAWWFWTGGVMKCLADSAQVLSPLLVKVRLLILPYITHYYCLTDTFSRQSSNSRRILMDLVTWESLLSPRA